MTNEGLKYQHRRREIQYKQANSVATETDGWIEWNGIVGQIMNERNRSCKVRMSNTV